MSIGNFRLLFFGSDAFSLRVLKPVLDKNLCPIRVVTKPHTLLDEFSKQHNLTKYEWRPGLSNISQDEFNIGLVASFGQMIDPTAVRKFHYGLFNTHPSLLPQFRGSTPVQAAVFHRLEETGCTIIRIPPVELFDIGDIIFQRKLHLKPRESALELRDRLADLSSSMVVDFLNNYELYLRQAKAQNSQAKSLARKLKPEQGCLKFRSETVELIDRKVLAYTGFIAIYTICLGGLYVQLSGVRDPEEVKAFDLNRLLKESTGQHSVAPGTIYYHKLRRLICIKAFDDQWTAFEYATPRGKPLMSALDFNNGYLSKVDSKLRLTDI